MYCKIIDLYFSTAGEQLTSSGESADTLDPLEITAGETFALQVQIVTTETVDGILNMHQVALPPETKPEVRGISADTGDVMFAAKGEINDGKMFFVVNTSTGVFREAAQEMDQEFFLVFADVSTSDTAPHQLGRIPFHAIIQCNWSLTPPDTQPPEYLSRSAVMALWESDITLFFSKDNQEWHTTYSASDIYFKIARPGGGSGPALPIPSCDGIRIDSFGKLSERPSANSGCRFFLDDSTGMLSVSDGTSWSNSFPLTGPAGSKGTSTAAVPAFFPCTVTENGRIAADLNSSSPEILFLYPISLPVSMTLNWQRPATAGSVMLRICAAGEVLAETIIDASAAGCTFFIPGNGREQLTLQRLTDKKEDTLQESLLITGATLKYQDI